MKDVFYLIKSDLRIYVIKENIIPSTKELKKI